MRMRTLSMMMVLAGLVLAGCAAGPHADNDTQSFLGISQDIRSVFGTQSDYLNPLQPVFRD